MSEASKEAGNKIVRCACRSETSDFIINPLVLLIALISYLVFAIYYMIIIRQIDIQYGLPWHMSVAVYLLALIGILLAMVIYYFILFRNESHSKREASMRGYIIDYLSVRYAEGGLDLGPIDDLRRMDSEIRGEEHTVPLKKTAYLLLIPAAVLIISLFVVPMKTHLGEVTIIMMIEMLAIGLIITPSATSFPHGHEERYIPFHRAVTDACKRIGMDVPEFSGTTTELDPRKLSYITVATLGLASIYWSCVLIVQMNHHFIAHRISDNGFVESMWVCETGHTIQEGGLKPIPAKNKLLFYGGRHKR